MLPATRNPTYNFIVIYSQLDHQPAEPQPRRLDREPPPNRAQIASAERPAGADIPMYYSRLVFVDHEPPRLSPDQTTLTPSRSHLLLSIRLRRCDGLECVPNAA